MDIVAIGSDVLILMVVSVVIYLLFLQDNTRKTPVSVDYNKVLPMSIPENLPTMTHAELLEFNGLDGKPIYVGIANKVFDCSAGAKFYGVGGDYHSFAGRDISRAAGKFSTDEKYLLNWSSEDLNNVEQDSMKNWFNVLYGKYPMVAKLAKETPVVCDLSQIAREE